MLRKLRNDKIEEQPNEIVDELKRQLAEAEAELSGFRSVQDITEIEIRDLKKQLAQSGNGSAGAADDVVFLREQLAIRDRELASLRNASVTTPDVESLRVKASQNEYLVGQLESARATIAKLESEMLNQPALSQAAFDHAIQRNHDLEVQIGTLREDYDSIATQQQTALKEISSLQSQLANAAFDQSERNRLTTQLDDAEAKLKGREQAIDELRKELTTITARSTALQLELDEVNQISTNLQIQNQRLQDDLANAKFELGESQGLRSKIAALQSELDDQAEVAARSNRLQQQVMTLEAELSKANALLTDHQSLTSKISEFESEIRKTEALRDDAEYVRTLLTQALDRLDRDGGTTSCDLPGFLSPLPKTA